MVLMIASSISNDLKKHMVNLEIDEKRIYVQIQIPCTVTISVVKTLRMKICKKKIKKKNTKIAVKWVRMDNK